MKNVFSKIASAIAMTMAVFTSCEEKNLDDEYRKDEVVPVSWTPNQTSYTVHIGDVISVEGVLKLSNGQEMIVPGLCTSLNPDVIKAENSFEALAFGLGTAKIKAVVRFSDPKDVNDYTHVFESEISAEVVAYSSEISSLEISPADVTIAHGESFTYQVTAVYTDGKRKMIDNSLCEWTHEDDGEQHLTYTLGIVTGYQGEGETIITATYNKEGKSVSASGRVLVEDKIK